jgi:hypothetical protein
MEALAQSRPPVDQLVSKAGEKPVSTLEGSKGYELIRGDVQGASSMPGSAQARPTEWDDWKSVRDLV